MKSEKFYPNGNLHYTVPLDENNEKHGTLMYYYESGELEFEILYEHGQKNGIEKCWNKDGTRNYIGRDNNNSASGPYIEFN